MWKHTEYCNKTSKCSSSGEKSWHTQSQNLSSFSFGHRCVYENCPPDTEAAVRCPLCGFLKGTCWPSSVCEPGTPPSCRAVGTESDEMPCLCRQWRMCRPQRVCIRWAVGCSCRMASGASVSGRSSMLWTTAPTLARAMSESWRPTRTACWSHRSSYMGSRHNRNKIPHPAYRDVPAEHVLLASASMPRSLRAQKHIQGHLKITGMSLMQLNYSNFKAIT